jgi:outer membrane protein OmpA-like peptidoglycan-associated protein
MMQTPYLAVTLIMRIFTIASFISFFYLSAESQNLIANGGFEDENICTEYIKNCAPEAWIATSLYSNYYFDEADKAYDGRHFIGLTAGSIVRNGVRNFARTRLLCGLRKGHQYLLEFYVFSVHNILDSIGIYFTTTDFLYENRHFSRLNPALWSVDGLDSPRQKSEVWQKVHLLYTATGNEGFIVIGNFKRIDYTDIRKGDYRFDYYFFVDKVSLVPVDVNETLCVQADSVRRDSYAENERHTILEKRMYMRRRFPLDTVRLPPTQMPPELPPPPVQHIDTLIIPDIFFATASYRLSPKSFHLLDSFANQLNKFDNDSLVISGHTDSIGKVDYNEKLSLNRAISVKEYLSAKVSGLREKTITRGYAYRKPVATNKTPQGRQQNRRVEILVYRKE